MNWKLADLIAFQSGEKKGAHHSFECDEDLHMKKVQSWTKKKEKYSDNKQHVKASSSRTPLPGLYILK